MSPKLVLKKSAKGGCCGRRAKGAMPGRKRSGNSKNASVMKSKLARCRKPTKTTHKLEKWIKPLRAEPKGLVTVHDCDLVWLEKMLKIDRDQVLAWMRELHRPIFYTAIPGRATKLPSQDMLARAKERVVFFYAVEMALGKRSAVLHAFRRAAGEELDFDWQGAHERVMGAKFDRRKKVDKWEDALGMAHGDSNGQCSIAICGHKKMTESALTSILAHEGLHNFATRRRAGYKWLSSDREHAALALLGDPIL